MNKRQHGFTFIEVLAVLSIIALATIGVLSLRDWAASNARVADAKVQIATLQSGVQQWRPRNGIYTGVSIQNLSTVAAVPIDWSSGSEINPWGGDISVTADTSDPTRYIVRLTGIPVSEEGQRLVRDYGEIASSVTFSSGTFEVVFQG